MNARAEFKALAKSLGLTVETQVAGRQLFEVQVWTPKGRRFAEGLHTLVNVSNYPDYPVKNDEVWAEALADLKGWSTEPCDDPECEICHEEDAE